MYWSRKCIGILLVLMMFMTGCGKTEKIPELVERNDIEMVDYPVEVKDLTDAEYYQGYLRKDMEKQSFKVSGFIDQMYVKPGDQVKKGQLLAKLDCKDMEDELKSLKASNEKEEKLRENQEKQLALQMDDMQSELNELTSNGANEQEVMLKRISVEELRENADYSKKNAETEKQNREEQIAKLEKQIKEHYLYASRSGTLSFSSIEFGEGDVNAYETVFLISSDTFLVQLEKEVELRVLNAAKSIIAYVGGKPYKVIREKTIVMKGGQETEEVLFRIKNCDEEKLGTKVLLEIVMRSKKDAVVVPEEALMKGLDGYYVYVKEKETKKKCPVKTGMRQNGYVHITEGLQGNEVCYGYQTVTLSGETKEETVSRGELREDIQFTSVLGHAVTAAVVRNTYGEAKLVKDHTGGTFGANVRKGMALYDIRCDKDESESIQIQAEMEQEKQSYLRQRKQIEQSLRVLNLKESGASRKRESLKLQKEELEITHDITMQRLEESYKKAMNESGSKTITAQVDGYMTRPMGLQPGELVVKDVVFGTIKDYTVSLLKIVEDDQYTESTDQLHSMESKAHFGSHVNIIFDDGSEHKGTIVQGWEDARTFTDIFSDLPCPFSVAKFDEDNASDSFYQTQSVRVLFDPYQLKDGIVISNSFIYQEQEQNYVWVKSEKRLEKRFITIGFQAKDKAWIVNGLEEGEVIVAAKEV